MTTKLLYSISSNPGKMGETFYNALFERYGMDVRYKAIASVDVHQTINELIQLPGFAGCSISMPFKRTVVSMLDHADQLVSRFDACNTVVYAGGQLRGFNTDFSGVDYTLSKINTDSTCAILGNGCMGQMYYNVVGPQRATMYSRSLGNWDMRGHGGESVVINCTALGTVNKQSPFQQLPTSCKMVIDLAVPIGTELEQQCIANGVQYVSGFEFYKRQFVEQFKIYTEKSITIEDMELTN